MANIFSGGGEKLQLSQGSGGASTLLLINQGKRLNLTRLFYVSSTGGLKEFCRDYQNLCENAPVNICHVTDFPPSPTTCDSLPGRPQGMPVTAILPYLYLGNEEGAADEALIDRLSIKYILNLTPRCPNFFSQRSDMHYKQIKINDSNQEDIGQHFDEAIQFIGKFEKEKKLFGWFVRHCWREVTKVKTSNRGFELSPLLWAMDNRVHFRNRGNWKLTQGCTPFICNLRFTG